MTERDTGPPKGNGVTYATTREGFDLPIIDITNARFAVSDDPAAVREVHDAFVEGERRRRRIPKFIMRMLLRRAAPGSCAHCSIRAPGTSTG